MLPSPTTQPTSLQHRQAYGRIIAEPNAPASEHSLCHPPTVPPPLIYHKSPYARVPLPSQVDTEGLVVDIHPILRHTTTPAIRYDLSEPPPSPSSLGANGRALYEPATYPPLPSLSLLIPGFPWPITTHASCVDGGNSGVTVLDVLTALFHALLLPAQENARASVPILSAADSASTRVVRRLVYLDDRTTFSGLSQSGVDTDTMIVHLR